MATKQPLRLGRLGHDFLPFYTAGCFVRAGKAAALYDLDAIRAAEHATALKYDLDLGDAVGPFWNPPFYAIFLTPLSILDFPAALLAWTLLNAAAVAASIALLWRMLAPHVRQAASMRAATVRERTDGAPAPDGESDSSETSTAFRPLPYGRGSHGRVPATFQSLDSVAGWKTWLLIALIIFTSVPCIEAFTHGQNTGLSLLLLTLAATAWRNGHGFWAGLVVGLLGYKPQLAALAAAVVAIDLGRRAILGMAVSGGGLLLLNLAALPGTLSDYLHRLPFILNYMQVDRPYIWERHATLRAFWRLLLQGWSVGPANGLVQALASASALGLLAALAFAMRRSHVPSSALAGAGRVGAERSAAHSSSAPSPALPRSTEGGRSNRDRLIAATVLAMPLVMPFYFDYDLLLLTVPAALLAKERSAPRPLVAAWVALYLWLTINPDIAQLTRVNLAVPLLVVIAIGTMRRVGRPAPKPAANAVGEVVAMVLQAAAERN